MSRSGDRPIRVLLVDDHAVVRKGLRALLDRESGIDVTGEAENGEQALRAADRLHPDVILMDPAGATSAGGSQTAADHRPTI